MDRAVRAVSPVPGLRGFGIRRREQVRRIRATWTARGRGVPLVEVLEPPQRIPRRSSSRCGDFLVCSSAARRSAMIRRYTDAARETGVEIARRAWTWCTAARGVGLMGVVERGVGRGRAGWSAWFPFPVRTRGGHDGITFTRDRGSLTERQAAHG